MKKALLILLMLCIPNMPTFAHAKNKTLSWNEITEKEKNNWSFFWNALKFQDKEAPKVQFEWGLLAYTTNRENWTFTRLEPFIKLRWAIIKKYLQPYIIFSLDKTNVKYNLSNYYIGFTKVSLKTEMQSVANPTYGGGLQIFLIGWKWINLYGYGQFQTSALNDATLKSAEFSFGNFKTDIYEDMVDHMDINYNVRRYDCGTIITYQPFSWFITSLFAGYIWIDVNIELAIDEELANTIKTLTRVSARDIIPQRFTLSEKSPFAMLGLKFRIYKRLHIALEGTIVPVENPIYFGQVSLLIEGNR